MVLKKKAEGEIEVKELWDQKLVTPIPMNQYAREVAEVEKIILFGESNTGKTRWYLNMIARLKKQGLIPEKALFYIIFPDRPTGIVKLYNLLPKEYLTDENPRIHILPVNNYEEMVSATAVAEEALLKHFKETGTHGWLISELLEEAWKNAQDYYCRRAYGTGLGEYFAQKRQNIKILKDDTTAYRSLEGWGDWPIIKYFHNFNWVDKIKRMPFNVLFTAEIKEEGNKDSIFYSLGYRPSGEKDNLHRVDTILYLSHQENNFSQRCFKLTGYDRIYSSVDITNKNGYEEHQKILKHFESKGYKSSAIEELEKEAGIPPPPKKEEPKPEEEKTIKTISKGENGKEKEGAISKEELTEKPTKEKKEVKWEI